jgi:hypothetical protein
MMLLKRHKCSICGEDGYGPCKCIRDKCHNDVKYIKEKLARWRLDDA